MPENLMSVIITLAVVTRIIFFLKPIFITLIVLVSLRYSISVFFEPGNDEHDGCTINCAVLAIVDPILYYLSINKIFAIFDGSPSAWSIICLIAIIIFLIFKMFAFYGYCFSLEIAIDEIKYEIDMKKLEKNKKIIRINKCAFWREDNGWDRTVLVYMFNEYYDVIVRIVSSHKETSINAAQKKSFKKFYSDFMGSRIASAGKKKVEEELIKWEPNASERFTPTMMLFEKDGTFAYLFDDKDNPDSGIAYVFKNDTDRSVEIMTQDKYFFE